MIVSARGMGAGAAILGGAGGAVLASAPLAGPAAPFVAAAGAIMEVLAAIGVGNGCGATCVQATSLVNQAEPVLLQNLQQYEAGEIDQATAQSTFNQIWQSIQEACGAIPGDGGQQCITDRQQGACTWKATNQPYPASPPTGSCWNWYNGYYVPLTQPPVTQSTSSSSSVVSGVSDLVSSVVGSGDGVLLVGGAVLLGIMMIGSGE